MTSPKTAIVTGANHGIGFETTVGMAEAGVDWAGPKAAVADNATGEHVRNGEET